MIIDTHSHLMFPEFNEDLEKVLMRAYAAGVERIINVGCDVKSSKQAVEMAEKYDALYATVGLHPYDALYATDELMKEWEKLILEDKASGRKKIVAIGEIGLDYFKAKVGHYEQKEAFRKQLKLAQKVELPVIVHNRGADEECLEILKVKIPSIMAVFHCYGSNLKFAKKVWEAGFMTSFTGIITYPDARELREVVKEAPLDKFMLETDCPYLAPQSHRGKRNEPAYIVEIAEMIAKLKGMDVSDVEKLAAKNAKKFLLF